MFNIIFSHKKHLSHLKLRNLSELIRHSAAGTNKLKGGEGSMWLTYESCARGEEGGAHVRQHKFVTTRLDTVQGTESTVHSQIVQR